VNVRRVEPRNTPTMINAVFNRRNFWDGRARNLFNGVTPFGDRDNSNAFLVRYSGSWSKEQRLIPYLSLASQAVGPVVSDLEMICNGRSLADFGKKTLPRQPLANQKVATTDGVLASFRNSSGLGLGLTGTYADLVKAVFQDKWWNGGTIPAGQGLPFEGYQQIEANFSLFWGLAVASYQGTLISDDSPYDRYKDSGATSGFAAQEGLDLFRQNGCIFCHNGPLFSEATSFDYKTAALEQAFGPAHVFRNRPIDSLFVIKADGSLVPALIDQGFFNLGVRPTGEDLGVTNIPDNSLARKYIQSVKAGGSATQSLDGYAVNPCDFTVPLSGDAANHCAPTADQLGRDGVDGSFKVPSLRNVELTGPYFHTGGAKSLEEVLDFYRRGGNSRKLTNDPRDNTTGFAANDTNLAPLFPLGISDAQAGKIIDFLKSLTDDRVRCEKAPFDHPSLRVFQGIEGDENGWKDLNANGSVDETVIELPAVGSGGLPALGRECVKPFDTKLTAGLPAN
jgi:cytochrome c peroxidase